MISKHRFVVSVLSLSLSLVASPALAVPANVPSSADPGVLSRSLDKTRPMPDMTKDLVKIAPSAPESATAGDEKEAFTLEQVILDGSTIYDAAAVRAAAAPYIGKPASLSDLRKLANALTIKYRNDGYIFSRVVVPPQKIKTGTVHLSAIEGRITDVKFTGNFNDGNGLIKSMADKLKSGSGPANQKDIERYLLLINDLPGVTARSVVSPASVAGGGELTIDVEQKSIEASITGDSRGSRYLGPIRGTAVVAANNMFGLHDRTTVRGIASSDTKALWFGDISHEEQIGSDGTRVKATYSRTRTRPVDALEDLDIKGDSDSFDLEGMYPLLRSRNTNINLLAGFNSLGSESYISGLKIAEDRVRTIRAGAHFDSIDGYAGINQVDGTVTQGLSILDATKKGLGRTRANGNPEFMRFNLSASRVQDLTNNFSLYVGGSGQYADAPLLASEEFALGGGDFGRAFDSGEVTGEHGIAGVAELRYGEDLDTRYVKSYQFFTYYDQGRVWNDKRAVGENASDALSSVGAGVRFNLISDISGSFEIDKPLTRKVSAEGDKEPRIFITLTKRF